MKFSLVWGVCLAFGALADAQTPGEMLNSRRCNLNGVTVPCPLPQGNQGNEVEGYPSGYDPMHPKGMDTPEPSPAVLLIAAGANDMLQGLPPKDLSANLQAMVKSLQARGIRVALAGMRAQLSLGAKYRKEFDAVYPAVAKAYRIPLYPFLLEGVALNARYNQEDAIHPNAKGAEIIAQRLAPFAASAFDLKRVAK